LDTEICITYTNSSPLAFSYLKNSHYICNTCNKYRSETLSLSSVHHLLAQTTDQRLSQITTSRAHQYQITFCWYYHSQMSVLWKWVLSEICIQRMGLEFKIKEWT